MFLVRVFKHPKICDYFLYLTLTDAKWLNQWNVDVVCVSALVSEQKQRIWSISLLVAVTFDHCNHLLLIRTCTLSRWFIYVSSVWLFENRCHQGSVLGLKSSVDQSARTRDECIDLNTDTIDTNAGIGIGSMLERWDRYFVSILQVEHVAHCFILDMLIQFLRTLKMMREIHLQLF